MYVFSGTLCNNNTTTKKSSYMLNINTKAVEGKTFYKNNDQSLTEHTCIGVGQAPDTGANYVVGVAWDQANNRSKVDTFLLKDITWVGQLNLV